MQEDAFSFLFNVLPLIFIVLAIVLAFVIPAFQAKKRAEMMHTLAQRHFLDYRSQAKINLSAQLEKLHLLRVGRDHHIRNILLDNTKAIDIRVFDLQYKIYKSGKRRTRQRTAIVLRSTEWQLPLFHLMPTKGEPKVAQRDPDSLGGMMSNWVMAKVGFNPKLAQAFPELKDKFLIQAEYVNATTDLLNCVDRLALSEESDVTIEGNGHYLAIYDQEKMWSEEKIISRLSQAKRIYAIFDGC